MDNTQEDCVCKNVSETLAVTGTKYRLSPAQMPDFHSRRIQFVFFDVSVSQ